MFSTSIDLPRAEWRKPARRARAAAAGQGKWSARRTLAFIVVTNTAAWALIIAGVRAL